MASLAAILRKSASLSLRFTCAGAKSHGSLNRASTALLQGPSSMPRYSSSIASPKRPASDEVLLRLVNREIKCEEEKNELDQTGEVPNGFPFKIELRRYHNLFLTGKYHSETIKLQNCYINCSSDSSDSDDSESDDSESDGSDEEKDNDFSISLSVIVSKDNGSSLNFVCTGGPDKITIDGVSAKYSEDGDERSIYFSQLDDEMQKALTKFLEMRGINTGTISFVHQFIRKKKDKESKNEHLKGLNNLKKFLEA